MNTGYYKILTPKGNGGIATISIYGQELETVLVKLFKPFAANKSSPLPDPGIFKYGSIINKNEQALDEVLLAKINKDHFEIHTHGGIFSLRKIIMELESNQFLQLKDNQQKINIEQQYLEILADITNIKEYEFIENQTQIFQNTFSKNEEYTFEQKIKLLQTMIQNWKSEIHQRRRVKICLAGLPNAGKSSLINCITGKKRALVSQQERTTRDTITENFQTKGYRFQLIDTAGIHQPDNILDEKSVALAFENIKKSEIIIWLHSIESAFKQEENEFLKKIKEIKKEKTPLYLAITKSDLSEFSSPIIDQNVFDDTFLLSSESGDGIEGLLEQLVSAFFDTKNDQNSASALSNKMVKDIEQLILDVDLNESNHKMIDIYMEELNELTKLMHKKER
ncbi:MAG: hypothetical protein COA79_04795 [Planctomycetota bacterium]|nr:MAG: hypothetical protein COA79_04795 [Planctomycetota bacterium]